MSLLRRPFKAITKVYGPEFADSEAQARSVQEGDRVLLSSAVLDAINSELKGDNMPYPIIFKVTNEANAGVSIMTHVGVLEFSTQRGMAIFPPQVMKTLGLETGGTATLRLVSLPTAGKAIFKPLTPEFAELDDPQAVLQNAFRIYTTLTQGTIISLPINGKRYDLFVQELFAAGSTKPVPAVCLIDSELIVDFIGMPERKDTSVTDLTMGATITGELGANEKAHYRVKLEHPELGIEIECSPVPQGAEAGDPDLFVSTQTLKPNELKCEWSDQELGRSHIIIYPSDPKYSKTWYYITVHAYKVPCKYSLFVGAPRMQEEEFKALKLKQRSSTGHLLRQTSAESREYANDPNMEMCTICREYVPKGLQMRLHAARCQKQMWRCPLERCGALIGQHEKDKHIHCDSCDRILSSTRELAKHIDIIHGLRPCSACDAKITLAEMQAHLTTKCPFRQVQCKYCDLKKPFIEMDEHQNLCGSRTVNCKICQKLVVLRRMDVHLAAEHGINPSLVDTSGYLDELKSPTLPANTSSSEAKSSHTFTPNEDEDFARALAESLLTSTQSRTSNSAAKANPISSSQADEDAILAAVIEASLREQERSARATDDWVEIPDDETHISVGSWDD